MQTLVSMHTVRENLWTYLWMKPQEILFFFTLLEVPPANFNRFEKVRLNTISTRSSSTCAYILVYPWDELNQAFFKNRIGGRLNSLPSFD